MGTGEGRCVSEYRQRKWRVLSLRYAGLGCLWLRRERRRGTHGSVACGELPDLDEEIDEARHEGELEQVLKWRADRLQRSAWCG